MPFVQTTILLNEKACFAPPPELLASLEQHQLPNTYTCPLGRAHGSAWLLMQHDDITAIIAEKTFTLKFKAERAGDEDEELKIPELLWVRATRLNVGEPEDKNAPYLVELADRRIVLERYSSSEVLLSNVRSAAQDADYLKGTEKSWDELIKAIWETMPPLGEYPGAGPGEEGGEVEKIEGTSVPEGYDIRGENTWETLNNVLETLGMAVKYDPLESAFSIVKIGDDKQELPDAYDTRLIRDTETIEHGSTRAPETIRVAFHKWYKNYGQEEDTEIDGWQTKDASVVVDIPTNDAGAVVGTVLTLWDDLAATLDKDNSGDNTSDYNERAQARADAWLAEAAIDANQTTYIGFLKDVLPGEKYKSIQWSNTGTGSTTTLVAVSGQVTSAYTRRGGVATGQEELIAPDLSRRTFQNWPRLPNVVQVSATNANTDGVFPGYVYRVDGDIAGSGTLKKFEECWIRFIDNHATAGGELSATASDFFSGRLSGVAESTDESEIDLTGTLTATNGSDAITGAGTLFESELNEGDKLTIDGVDYTIEEVVDDTHLTLTENFTGTTDGYPVKKSATIRPLYVARRGLPPTAYGKANENWRKSGDSGSESFTGTITAVNGSASIQGVGTLFITELRLGMTLLIDGAEYNIIAIDAEAGVAAITLSKKFTGTSAGLYAVQTPALVPTPTTPWIRVNPTSNILGTSTDYSKTHIVYWANFYAVTTGNGSAEDPNVEAGQIIAYHGGTDGEFVTQGYYDGKIGDAIFQTKTFEEKQGWKLMDGFRNSASVGGSGIDMSCRFPRGSYVTDPTPAEDPVTPGTVDALHAGGSKDHYHRTSLVTTVAKEGTGADIFVLQNETPTCTSTNKDQADCDCGTPPECGCEGEGNPCKLPIEWQHLYYMERIDNSEGFTPP